MHALRFIWLKKGGKYVAFDLHRQFLPPDHPDREGKKNFTKGLVVHEVNEIPTFSGEDVLAQLKALKPKGEGKGKGKGKGKTMGEGEGEGQALGKGKGKGKGKRFEGYGEAHNWTHITPFAKLPYFKDLKLPYNIDVMHTEKNVAEFLFCTILNIADKTNDNVKARADQQRICDRPRLNMKPPTGGRRNWFKPDADFVLKQPEKKEVLIWLKAHGRQAVLDAVITPSISYTQFRATDPSLSQRTSTTITSAQSHSLLAERHSVSICPLIYIAHFIFRIEMFYEFHHVIS
jgi:hypothetical protein